MEIEPNFNELGPLSNPSKDIAAMAALFRDLKFDSVEPVVEMRESKDIRKAVNQFAKRVAPGATVVFYYSGHGIGHNNQNYLLSTGHGYD